MPSDPKSAKISYELFGFQDNLKELALADESCVQPLPEYLHRPAEPKSEITSYEPL